jgi:hypothetical protein
MKWAVSVHALLFAVVLASCGREPSTSNPTADVFCQNDEAQCLKQLAGMATRNGDYLRLTLANGQTKTFTTTGKDCEELIYEKCLWYRLREYFPQHRQFLVEVGDLNEAGSTYFLVSAGNGSQVKLDAVPHYSPSRKRFAAVSATEQGGEPNSIQIWSMVSELPKSEWRYTVPEGEDARYEFVGWDGDERLKMTVTTRIGGGPIKSLPVEAVLASDGWKLMPAGK